jgi:hypothetical protein
MRRVIFVKNMSLKVVKMEKFSSFFIRLMIFFSNFADDYENQKGKLTNRNL